MLSRSPFRIQNATPFLATFHISSSLQSYSEEAMGREALSLTAVFLRCAMQPLLQMKQSMSSGAC
jgi:hypothetical protein